MWEAVGNIVAYGYSASLCVSTKLYIAFGIMLSGSVGYYVVEYTEFRKTKQSAVSPLHDHN